VLEATARLERALPAAFRLEVPDGALGGAAAGASGGTVFTATRSPEGVTILRGAAGGHDEREVVETFAAARFSADGLHMSLRPAADMPEGWSVRVLAGLDAFADLDRGRLRVTADRIALHGVTGDPQRRAQLATRLSDTLGPSEPVTLDIRYAEALDPVAAQPTPEACLADIKAIQARTKITFAPGSTELDRDARRIVDRIARVLRGCGDVAMEITGHTDSQGGREMNLDLSEARARAVLEALIAERVLASSLSAAGYGETRPVADNATEAGREANRRIEFRLKYPLEGPPPPPDTSDQTAAASETEASDGSE